MREELGLTQTSEIQFSDYSRDLWHPEDRIRFSKDVLLFCHKGYAHEDDWLEYDEIEFCPWSCILGIDVINGGGKTVKTISKEEIDKWRLSLKNFEMYFPYCHCRKGCYVIMMEGKPFSERSEHGKKFFSKEIEKLKPQIQSVLPEPTDGYVEVFIDVFTTQYKTGVVGNNQKIPDVDRLIHPITDSLQGIIIKNDRQVRKASPRIWDITDAFRIFECRTEPMGLYAFKNIPIGILFPLSKGIMNYYSIRVISYYL